MTANELLLFSTFFLFFRLLSIFWSLNPRSRGLPTRGVGEKKTKRKKRNRKRRRQTDRHKGEERSWIYHRGEKMCWLLVRGWLSSSRVSKEEWIERERNHERSLADRSRLGKRRTKLSYHPAEERNKSSSCCCWFFLVWSAAAAAAAVVVVVVVEFFKLCWNLLRDRMPDLENFCTALRKLGLT